VRFIHLSLLAAIVAVALPSAATAAERPPAGPAQAGIIAVLIGQVQAQPFTPPIGTDKGS
jgi:hypothetical protein